MRLVTVKNIGLISAPEECRSYFRSNSSSVPRYAWKRFDCKLYRVAVNGTSSVDLHNLIYSRKPTLIFSSIDFAPNRIILIGYILTYKPSYPRQLFLSINIIKEMFWERIKRRKKKIPSSSIVDFRINFNFYIFRNSCSSSIFCILNRSIT